MYLPNLVQIELRGLRLDEFDLLEQPCFSWAEKHPAHLSIHCVCCTPADWAQMLTLPQLRHLATERLEYKDVRQVTLGITTYALRYYSQ